MQMRAEILKDWGIHFVPRPLVGAGLPRPGRGDPAPTEDVMETNKQKSLDALRAEIGDCTRCGLHKGRTNLVFGVGNPEAQLMFVGEAPGADEDLKGEPFVGRAGQLLTKMIEAMGLKRSDIYIANIIKSRPPGNRPPEPEEIAQCMPFLKKQIEIIQPKVIVCLGKFAAQTLLQTEIPITKLRGEFQKYGDSQIMPTYHPAFLLRNPAMKKPVWEDLKKVMKVLGL
jgi:DNA polymerase